MPEFNSLATLTAASRSITINGETLKMYPLTYADFGKLEAWIAEQYPDPLTVFEQNRERFPLAMQQRMLDRAMELAARPKPRLGSAEADALLQSVAGITQILVLSIAKGDPTFDQARADAVFGGLTQADLIRVFEYSNANMVISSADPKADGPAAT